MRHKKQQKKTEPLSAVALTLSAKAWDLLLHPGKIAAYITFAPLLVMRDMYRFMRQADGKPTIGLYFTTQKLGKLVMHLGIEMVIAICGETATFFAQKNIHKYYNVVYSAIGSLQQSDNTPDPLLWYAQELCNRTTSEVCAEISRHTQDIIAEQNAPEASAIEKWSQFTQGLGWFSVAITLYAAAYLAHHYVATFHGHIVRHHLTKNLKQKQFGPSQVMLAMSHSAAEHGVLSNLEYDINHVTANDSFRGLGLFKNAVTVLLQGSLAVPTLWGSSLSRIGPVSLPNFIIFPVAWALINKFSLDKLTAKVNSLEKQQEHLAIKADNIVYSDLTQSKTITLRGERALQQVAARQEEARDNIVALQKRVSNWSIFQGSARSLMQNCNTIVFFAIAGYSVVTRRFDPVNLFVTSRLVDNLYTLLFWGKDNGVAIRRQEVAIGRLSRFLEREEELRATPPSVKYKRDSQGNVILDKLSLSINGSSLLYIPYQQLECGGSYVLTGEKGTGKSSLLAKIMGVTQDGIRANGTITTADLTTIMSISQDNFLPAYATIFDAMCFPQQAPAAGSKDRAQMLKLAKQLLEEARIDHGNDKDNRNSIANNLELVAPDWNNSLSGGQKKIVQVVAAILQKPKIVLLDELFAGMDKATIQIIQRMLRQHLPHTTFITVDHNAGENNHPIHPPGKAERYFYDCELHIKNQRLSSNSDGIGFTR